MEVLQKTPLYDHHVALGAKIVPFAGFQMPVSYTGIVSEHKAVREAAGMFDVSHMGEFIVWGPGAKDFIQYATSNDVNALQPGKAQYSCLPNKQGGIVDDLLVYDFGHEHYMLVVNGSNIDKDYAHLEGILKEGGFDCQMVNKSADMGLLAVQGPKAKEILQKLTVVPLDDIPYYHFVQGKLGGVDDIIISATGYTGSGGFELYCNNEDAGKLWDLILETGKSHNLVPAGLGCRDTLRLEMGFCLYGNDIDDSTSPLEAGLGWITKLNKGDFISSAILKKQKEEGLKRKLVGLRMEDRIIPRSHFPIHDKEGAVIGEVSSGTLSPSLEYPIALGYVEIAHSKEGSEVIIPVRGKEVTARVVKLPFYNAKG